MSFLKKLLIYAAIVCCITIIVNAAYMKHDTTWYAADKYRSVPEHIKISNVGSSHGLASFNYNELSRRYVCFNFAGGRQQLFYDNRILQTYADHLEPGGLVFIPISYFSLYGESELKWEEFESYNNLYYRVLPNRLIRNYDPMIDFYVSYFPSLRAYFKLFPTVFNIEPSDEGGMAGLISEQQAEDIVVHADAEPEQTQPEVSQEKPEQTDSAQEVKRGVDPAVVKASAQSRYEGYVKRHRGILKQEGMDALYEMIDLLQERGVTPVLISTPIMIDFSACIRREDPAFYDDWHALIGEVCDKTGVAYYDYSEDDRIVYDYTLFDDADHMNTDGSARFTEIITEEIISDYFSE